MTTLPDFDAVNRTQLIRLGLCEEQVHELRYALTWVRAFAVADPPPRNAVRKLLNDIERYSRKLEKALAATVEPTTSAGGSVHALIEVGWWQGTRVSGDGPSVGIFLATTLKELSEIARNAKEGVPSGQTRKYSADPRPIRCIEQALHRGWTRKHGSAVFASNAEEGTDEANARRATRKTPPPYPPELIASNAEHGKFRQIAGICYQEVGGTPDPIAAIRAYLKLENEIRADGLAAMEKGIASVRKRALAASKKSE